MRSAREVIFVKQLDCLRLLLLLNVHVAHLVCQLGDLVFVANKQLGKLLVLLLHEDGLLADLVGLAEHLAHLLSDKLRDLVCFQVDIVFCSLHGLCSDPPVLDLLRLAHLVERLLEELLVLLQHGLAWQQKLRVLFHFVVDCQQWADVIFTVFQVRVD